MSRELFTAAEIGAALSKSRSAIKRVLAGCKPAGTKLVSNNLAEAWALEDLPAAIRSQLRNVQTRRKYRAEIDVLRNAPKRWMPALPLSEIDEKEIANAQKLQRALHRALALPAEATITERAALALADYSREFGHLVTDRYLRKLISRTLDRDAGAGELTRIELFLPDNPRPKNAGKTKPIISPFDLTELDEALAAVEDRSNLTRDDIAYCWRFAVMPFLENGSSAATALKNTIADHLWKNVPGLAKSRDALMRNLERKIKCAQLDGTCAISDKRRENSGNRRRAPQWDVNIMKLACLTRAYGGRESQAWRELHLGTSPTGERFTEAFREFYAFDVRSAKSRVPGNVRNALTPMMKATEAAHHGPKTARLAQASIHRDWSEVLAGDAYTSDDVTPNHYVYDWCEEGEFEYQGRRFNVTRCQWLPVVDERTDYPLGFGLIPKPTYNSQDIRSLMARLCMDEAIGLPFRQWTFERGIWSALKLSNALAGWSKVHDSFSAAGINLRIHHATTPKAKIIERVIGQLQNMMEHLPGYAGRMEQRDRYERQDRFRSKLKKVGQPLKAEVNPAEELMSKDEFAREIEGVMKRFAREPQNGERLPGISPEEGWQQLSGGRIHKVLPESLAYVLNTEVSEQRVGGDGIKLKIGGLWHYYARSNRLGELIGERVRVRYDPEIPEQVVVCHLRTDPHERAPFIVPVSERIPAHGASKEDFRAAHETRKAFKKYGDTVYRALRPSYNLTLRDERLGSKEMRSQGALHEGIQRDAIELRDQRKTLNSEISILSAQVGIRLDPDTVANPTEQRDRLKRILDLEAECRALKEGADSQ